MKILPLPSLERINELLDYNPATGMFIWKVSKGSAKAGAIAGNNVLLDGKQYIRIAIDRCLYLAHRIAYYINTGLQPQQVDHKNDNGLDNRKVNLRNGDNNINQRNAKMRKDNTSGVIGVNWHKRIKSWIATFGGRDFQKKHGTQKGFANKAEAISQRKLWENQYGMTELKKHRRTDVT